MMNNRTRFPTITLLALLTAACGGGGGGSDDPGTVTFNEAEITTGNADAISRTVVDGMMETAALGEFGDLAGLGSVGVEPGGTLSKTAITLATKTGEARAKALPTLMYEPFDPGPTPCAAGGTVTVSANLQQPDTLTAGDSITARFADCDDGDGRVVSGTLRLVVDAFDGDFASGLFAAGVDLSFDVLSVTEDGETNTVNGDIALFVDTRRYPVVAFSHSGRGLAITERGETMVFAEWSNGLSVDGSSVPAGYSLTGNGRIDVPRHGGVSYRVDEAFTGFGDTHPISGVLYLEGRDGASITITSLSNEQLQLEMDYDGDGVVDEVRLRTWAELEG
jgi:hypothetical protein